MTTIALGWRVHSSSAVLVALSGPAASPEVLQREVVPLLDVDRLREPYHVAAGMPRDEVPALLESVAEAAASAAAAKIQALAAAHGSVAGVGVVGGNRKLPELAKILKSHALLHAAERDLYEQSVIEGAARLGHPVATIAATGALFGEASRVLGFPVEPTLAALGKAVGSPWGKDYREAAAVALVALSLSPHD